jgi:hypothetical protein
MQALLNRGMISSEEIFGNALANIRTLDKVYLIDDLEKIKADIQTMSGAVPRGQYRDNVNTEVLPSNRAEELKNRGATEKVLAKLDASCAQDTRLWKAVSEVEH